MGEPVSFPEATSGAFDTTSAGWAFDVALAPPHRLTEAEFPFLVRSTFLERRVWTVAG